MASHKILVTGGSGYIGGSVIASLLSPKTGTAVQPGDIIAVVRKEEHAAKMTKLGIEVVNADLSDGPSMQKLVLDKDVDIVVHCASAADHSLARPLIEALGKQKDRTGREVYFVHTSGTSAYSNYTGWKHGLLRDTDSVYELEKSTEESYFLRDTNIAVYELAKQHQVTASIVVPPLVYGEGTGECGKLTIMMPLFIQASINLKAVYKHEERSSWPAVHIADVADFYVLLIQRILSGEASAASLAGYYFPIAHDVDWWETSDALARALHARGLVKETTVATWPSAEAAGEALGLPVLYVHMAYRSTIQAVPVRPQQLGWKPAWDGGKYLRSFDAEVDAFLRLWEKSSAMTDILNLTKSKE